MTSEPVRTEHQVLGVSTAAWSYAHPEGALLVLVHGFRGDHHGLEGLARALAAQAPELRIVVPDLPGFGASSAAHGRVHDLDFFGAWLRAFVGTMVADGSGAKRFAILGHSFGSLVVANALSQGLNPQAVVLINPISAPALEGPQAAMTQLAIAYYRAAQALPERAARRLLGNRIIVRIMSEVMAKTGDPELRRWIHDQHERYFSTFSDPRTLLEAFRASVSHTVREYEGSFTAPTLLIAGDRDDITPLREQLSLAHRLVDGRLCVVPGVGHLVHYEAVDHATAEVLGFLRERVGEPA